MKTAMPFTTKPHGKLLLTGEYFVLDGVPALAVPTKLGQRLTVNLTRGVSLEWRANDHNGQQWFRSSLASPQLGGTLDAQDTDDAFTARLRQIFRAAEVLRPGVFSAVSFGRMVTTDLEFDREWGLGSSSTLIAAIAEWLEVDPYALLEATFGGSGYDLACAVADGPIVYRRNGGTPTVTPLDWRPAWAVTSCFVYRNQKQNSREGIRAYRKAGASDVSKTRIGEITKALQNQALHPRAAAQLLREHEQIVSATVGLPTVQDELFPTFPGQLKSLGAWGGDFIWAVSEESPEKVRAFFNERGYQTVIGYEDMVLSSPGPSKGGELTKPFV